jgi:ATP-binding cassette subfamily B protein RaxB
MWLGLFGNGGESLRSRLGRRRITRTVWHRPKGLTLLQLLNFAQAIGLQGRGVKLEPANLNQMRMPCILHWNLDHFVVLVGVRKGGVEIHDPAVGRRRVSWLEIDQSFTGVALDLWDTGEVQSREKSAQDLSLRSVWRLVRGGRQNLAWLVILSVLLQGLVLVGPWHIQVMVDNALVSHDIALIYVLAIAFAAILALKVCVSLLRSKVVIHLGHNLSFLFASLLLDHLLRLRLDWFGRRGTGDISARFASLQPVRDFFTVGAATLLVVSLIVVISLVAMLIYAPKLALVVVALQMVALLIHVAFLPKIKRLSLAVLVADGAAHSHLIESVRSIHSVKVYGQESIRFVRWQKLHAQTIRQSSTLQLTQAGLQSAAQFCSGLELLAVITLAGIAILEEASLTIGIL